MAKKVKEKAEVKVVAPEEDQKKLEQSLDLIELVKDKEEGSFDELVEKERKNIFQVYKKARTQNNIIMVITVAVMIGSLVLMTQVPNWGAIVGGVLIGAMFIFLVVHYILTRNLFPNTTKKYIRYFMKTVDDYVFDIKNTSEQKLYHEKRYAIADTMGDHVYKDVIDAASRNIVTFKYKDKDVEVGELALYKQSGAKKYQKTVLFVGKYMNFKNDFHFEDRYVIRIKGEKEVDAPNDIDDLVVLSEQNNFVVYGKEGAKFEKDLGKDLVNNLKSVDCCSALLNVNVVIWAERTAVYLSYDDSIVAIPFDHEIHKESYAQLKKNITELLEILIG